MEVYSSILNLELPKQPATQISYENLLRQSLLRNSHLLKQYSPLFRNTSRKMFPFKIRKFIVQRRPASDLPFRLSVRRCSAPTLPHLNASCSKFSIQGQKNYSKVRSQIKEGTRSQVIVKNFQNDALKKKRRQLDLEVEQRGLKSKKSIDDNIRIRESLWRSQKDIKKCRPNRVTLKVPLATQSSEEQQVKIDLTNSKLNIVWVGQNQNLYGDRIRVFLAKKQKHASVKLKNWLACNTAVSSQTSSYPDFFIHKSTQNKTNRKNLTDYLAQTDP